MCDVCGCNDTKHPLTHDHHGTHNHSHHHNQSSANALHFGNNQAGVSVAGVPDHQLVHLQENLFAKNQQYADSIRQYLADNHITAINLLSSPGAGKTSLLTKTIEHIKQQTPCFVIEGDQQTSLDADRIRATGAKTLQINTGKGCHLDGHMVSHALEKLEPSTDSYLFIENVGNLVCPAGFDLGESKRVVILSVTEGEDKPIKYPDIFHSADLLLINKIDLLPYLDFNLEQCIAYARQINPELRVICLSTTQETNLAEWLEWLQHIKQTQAQLESNSF